ncbi:MAG: histidine kinase dimerization/phospho-acceptor domain-containing protein [Oscillospiraceae bacterium]|jgi:signal transduction histidine kinase
MIYILLAALICSILLFLLQILVRNAMIKRYYLNDTAVAQRVARQIQELNEFVQKEALSSEDTEALSTWANNKRHVYLLLYKDDHLFFKGGAPSATWDDSTFLFNPHDIPNPDVEIVSNQDDTKFPIRFSDGLYSVALYDYSETYIYNACTIVALSICFIFFVCIMLIYSRRITKSIITLSQEMAEVCNGNLEKEITFSSDDELNTLANDINSMRISIIEQTKNEQVAWQANSDLITALSHDIRTPLTALLGYLDLSAGGQYQTEEQLHQYLTAGVEKAQQIKSLIEEIFQYFLVFGQPSLQMKPEEFDANILLEQLFGEHIIHLQDIGFVVKFTKNLQSSSSLQVDIIYLKRVFDNLFSNIEKHADRTKKVVIIVTEEKHKIRFLFSNSIPKIPNRVESTKIGLQTCNKIIQQLGGTFLTTAADHVFTAEFTLPL